MWNSKKSVALSIIVCAVCMAGLVATLFAAPWFFGIYFEEYRGYTVTQATELKNTLLVCFYPSALLGLGGLASLIKMLINIKKGEIFVDSNVTLLRVISWCCFMVAIITLVCGIKYYPLLIIAVAAAFAGIILRVVKNVMQSALELRRENELTI